MNLRFIVLHYHILKNAGSTIEEILEHSFHERLARADHDERDGVVSADELLALVNGNPQLAAVTSHSIRYPMPEAPGVLFFDICFLRDPLDRLRSMYDYFRVHPAEDDPVSQLANQASLGEFMASLVERFPLQCRDVQVNLIAAAGDSDEPAEADLELATARMMKTSFLGVVDRFDESVKAGEYFLKGVFPELDCALPPVNVSKGLSGTVESRTAQLRDACVPEVFEELLRLNALDFRLLERAREEIQRRVKLVPDPKVRRTVQPGVGARERLGDLKYLPLLMRSPLFEDGKPHALFDSAYYLRRYPDAAAAGVNPLAHYLRRGVNENRQPHPLFDPVFYLEKYPDVAAAGLNPLAHYVVSGSAEGRKPHRLFEPDYYLRQCPEAGVGNGNPLVHFAETVSGGGDPHRLFSCEAYCVEHPEVVEAGINPLTAYLEGANDTEVTGLVVDDVPLNLNAPEQGRFLRSLNPDQLWSLIGRASCDAL